MWGIREDGGAGGDEFRIELASTGHAGQHKSCKTSGIKIDKGQLQVGKLELRWSSNLAVYVLAHT